MNCPGFEGTDQVSVDPVPWPEEAADELGWAPPRPKLLLIAPDAWEPDDPVEVAIRQAGFAFERQSEPHQALAEVGKRSGILLALIAPTVPARLDLARRLRRADPALRIALLLDGTDAEGAGLREAVRADPRLRGACELLAVETPDRLVRRLYHLAERRSDHRPKRGDFTSLAGRLTAEIAGRRPHLELGSSLVSERYLVTLLEQASEGIISTDPDGRIVLWNLEAARMFGRPIEEALGRPFVELVPDDTQVTVRHLLDAAHSGEVARGELAIR
ncbi:MAG TPA: PAS domain-containing protein, partial [Dehalococcoidia bacterium]|nr:PAS domain-containing protein [Dehalococcoidia bacterium]